MVTRKVNLYTNSRGEIQPTVEVQDENILMNSDLALATVDLLTATRVKLREAGYRPVEVNE